MEYFLCIMNTFIMYSEYVFDILVKSISPKSDNRIWYSCIRRNYIKQQLV